MIKKSKGDITFTDVIVKIVRDRMKEWQKFVLPYDTTSFLGLYCYFIMILSFVLYYRKI